MYEREDGERGNRGKRMRGRRKREAQKRDNPNKEEVKGRGRSMQEKRDTGEKS